jgi:hypothetical protein
MTRHLLHIGYPKTATNFLRAWFDAHPQIAFKRGGFGGFPRFASIGSPSALAAEPPRLRVSSSELLATPHADVGQRVRYGADGAAFADRQARACATLAGLFPTAEVLIVTRGFRSMIQSSYSQYVRTGGTSSLAEFAASALENGAWNYDRLIALYAGAFGAERLILLPWELLRDRPEAFVAELQTRFGLDPGPVPANRPNPALPPAELRAQLRLNRTLGSRMPLLTRLYAGGAPTNRLRRPLRALARLSSGASQAEALDEALVQAYRGQAASLAGHPLFAPYAADYLF